MSPYIVTTKRPAQRFPAEPNRVRFQDDSPRAVTTLEEAQDYVHQQGATYTAAVITESGGSVGPLPDGTVIEVVPMDDWAMRVYAFINGVEDAYEKHSLAEVIDAFNAKDTP